MLCKFLKLGIPSFCLLFTLQADSLAANHQKCVQHIDAMLKKYSLGSFTKIPETASKATWTFNPPLFGQSKGYKFSNTQFVNNSPVTKKCSVVFKDDRPHGISCTSDEVVKSTSTSHKPLKKSTVGEVDYESGTGIEYTSEHKLIGDDLTLDENCAPIKSAGAFLGSSKEQYSDFSGADSKSTSLAHWYLSKEVCANLQKQNFLLLNCENPDFSEIARRIEKAGGICNECVTEKGHPLKTFLSCESFLDECRKLLKTDEAQGAGAVIKSKPVTNPNAAKTL